MWFDVDAEVERLRAKYSLFETGQNRAPFNQLAGLAGGHPENEPRSKAQCDLKEMVLRHYQDGAHDAKSMRRLGIAEISLREIVLELREEKKIQNDHLIEL